MKLLRETWVVFTRYTYLLVQSPAWVITGVLSPFFYVILFAPLLPTILRVPDPGAAYALFVPGLLVLLAVYSSLFAGIGLIGESRSGILDRYRVTPVSRLALLLGRCGREVATVVVQGVAIVVVATALGMRVGIVALLLAFVLVAMVTVMLSSLSYWLATRIANEQSMASVVQASAQPIVLLSGVLLPLSLAPQWMATVAWWNPLSHVVLAERALFAGHVDDPAVWQTTVVVATLTTLALVLARRAFTRVAT